LLGNTRDFLQSKIERGELTADQRSRAMNEIYAAEGSDWFWWYGDDFVTDNDLLFDELFRTHLQNVYHIVGVPVPDSLKTQICRSEIAHEARQPSGLVAPQVDGRVTDFYEWVGAGVYEAGRAMGAMYRSERLVESIHFGGDLQKFAFRLDVRGEPQELPGDLALRINFLQPAGRALIIPKFLPGQAVAGLWDAIADRCVRASESSQTRYDRILELTIPYADLSWESGDAVQFFVQILQGGVELERHPGVGTLNFTVPDEQFEVENWRV
jgi:hypothetical protein